MLNQSVQLSLPGRFLSVLIIKPHVLQNGKGLFFRDTRIAHDAGVLVGELSANGVALAVFARIQRVVYNKFRNAAGCGSPRCRSADGGIHGVTGFAKGGKNLPPLKRFRLADLTQPYNHLTGRGIYAENTARNYLNELADLQILQKKEISGKHYYINPALVEILSY